MIPESDDATGRLLLGHDHDHRDDHKHDDHNHGGETLGLPEAKPFTAHQRALLQLGQATQADPTNYAKNAAGLPLLSSRPGSTRKIFLDFDGHRFRLEANTLHTLCLPAGCCQCTIWTGGSLGPSAVVSLTCHPSCEWVNRARTAFLSAIDTLALPTPRLCSDSRWNDKYGDEIYTPPYDKDGRSSSFNAEEQSDIVAIWRAVSEDFSVFDVDVIGQCYHGLLTCLVPAASPS